MNDDKPVDRPDDKTYSITVNGRQRQVESEELSFDELVALAFEDPSQRAANRIHHHVPGGWRAYDRGRTGRRAKAEGAGRNDHQCHTN